MTPQHFQQKKVRHEKISMVTCYDYPSAQIISDSKIEGVLVGDSVAMAVHGYETTLNATLEMMIFHTQAVARGLKNKLLVSDLPFMCHRRSHSFTVDAVRKLMQAGAQAIKIEGADDHTCQSIQAITQAGVPVMGHIGLTPQHIHQLGGFKVQGKSTEQAQKLVEDAIRLEQAGCFALVIECVPSHVAQTISERVSIPTIGIGAGPHTDGQILVWHDVLGLQNELTLKFAKAFVEGKISFTNALNQYADDVSTLHFPANQHAW